jgi:phosphatidylinositol alpha-1,6-mannosyltransferase
MVQEAGLTDAVVFAGSVPAAELPDYYRTCDLFIMPNRTLADGDTEGFGLVFLEAAACGKPVVGGLAGGVPDAVEDGHTGLLVDCTKADEIADAAISILQDSASGERLGHAGLLLAAKSNWRARTAEFENACRCAVAGRKPERTSQGAGATLLLEPLLRPGISSGRGLAE